jgi:uncharacterized protein (TIGR00255 family)
MAGLASMTGYGRAEARGAELAVSVEARSLNHRFLEISVKSPRSLFVHEPEVRRVVQSRLARGRVDLAVSARRIAGSRSVVRTDAGLAAEYVHGARALAANLGLAGDILVGDVLRLPGVVTVEDAEEDETECRVLLKEALQHALDELGRMRLAEGALLAAEIAGHLTAFQAWAERLERDSPSVLEAVRQRAKARIGALLGEAPVDPARIAQEAAIWAAKSDAAEEIARLRAHCARFRDLLAAGGPAGRQLDFLAQEMQREVNTLAAKVDDAAVIARILEARATVERLREQVQNVE